jgi:hypothetical protein
MRNGARGYNRQAPGCPVSGRGGEWLKIKCIQSETFLIVGKIIARNLNIVDSTVKVHLKAILRKIRVQNRTQAAIWAVNHQDSVPRIDDASAHKRRTWQQLSFAWGG